MVFITVDTGGISHDQYFFQTIKAIPGRYHGIDVRSILRIEDDNIAIARAGRERWGERGNFAEEGTDIPQRLHRF